MSSFFTIENPKNKSIIEDQVPSWSTTLKICLGAMFRSKICFAAGCLPGKGGGSAGGTGFRRNSNPY